MALTPAEQAALDALTAKANTVDTPKTLWDVIHRIISFIGSGPVHDELHSAVNELEANEADKAAPPAAPEAKEDTPDA